MTGRLSFLLSALVPALAAAALQAQTVPPANYDEGKVPRYTLPDPLVLNDGQRVTDTATWRGKRRPEIVHLFEQYVYGKVPGVLSDLPVERPLGRSQCPGWYGHPHASNDPFHAPWQDRPAHLSPQEGPRSKPGFPGPELRRKPHDPLRPGHHAFRRADWQPAAGQTERRGGCQGPRGEFQPLADREDYCPRVRRGHSLVRRHRTGHAGRPSLRCAETVSQAGAN